MTTVEKRKVRVLLKKWIATANNWPFSIDGVVLSETNRAIQIDGHASVDAPVCCFHCGKALTHPVSKLIGIGPICAGDYGIGRYDHTLSEDEVQRLRSMVMNVKFSGWIPKAGVKNLEELGVSVLEDSEITVIEEPKEEKSSFTSKYSIDDFKNAKVFDNMYPDNKCALCGERLGNGKIAYKREIGAAHASCITGENQTQEDQKKLLSVADFISAKSFASTRAGTCKICDKPYDANDMVAGKKVNNEWIIAHKDCAFPEKAEIIKASLASSADVEVPGLKLSLFPFQKAGLAYVESKGGRAIIGDEMGLGKTPQSLAYGQLHPELRPMLVIAPANVKLNWVREVLKWLPETPANSVTVLGIKKISDELIKRGAKIVAEPCELKRNGIYIINYDIAHKWLAQLSALNPEYVVLDEFHYVKNPKALRTIAILGIDLDVAHEETEKKIEEARKIGLSITYFNQNKKVHIQGIAQKAKAIIPLSGTPFENRPNEMWPVLSTLFPDDFNNFWYYATRYCEAERTRFGLQFPNTISKRASTMLYEKLRETCMVRRLKKDVYKELPPKIRATVPLEIDNRSEYDYAEADFIEWLAESGEDTSSAEGKAKALVKINKMKQLALRGKIGAVKDWIENFLGTGEKLIVFAWHRETVLSLKKEFPDALTIMGGDDANDRDYAVTEFQNNENRKLIIISIRAGNMGLTLTSASNVVTVELGWTPSVHLQAEDRAHRISQLKAVTAWYLIGERTIDEQIAALIDAKSETISNVLDNGQSDKTNILGNVSDAEDGDTITAVINHYKKRSKTA